MSHVHNIIDTDSHFVIDPISRSVTTKSDKLYIVQYDHNSERFTFQIPRYVEEHDMSLCDRIEVHYTNILRTKKSQNDDVYIVKKDDCSFDNDTLFFSWLVSNNATQLVGYLKFSITFVCLDDNGNLTYEWSTAMYEDVQVLSKNKNSASVREQYPDLYTQLKEDILSSIPPSSGEVDAEEVEQIILEYFETNPPAQGEPGYSPTVEVVETETGYNLVITDANGSKTVELVHGKDGKDGIDGENGADAVSPTITVTETDTGHTITINDINGVQAFEVLDGKDGADAVSPTVTVNENDTGHVITITDVNGSQSFEVLNGTDGNDGVSPTVAVDETDTGHTITITDVNGSQSFEVLNGTDGEDGYTPVKGVDYYTEVEQEELIQTIISRLLTDSDFQQLVLDLIEQSGTTGTESAVILDLGSEDDESDVLLAVDETDYPVLNADSPVEADDGTSYTINIS